MYLKRFEFLLSVKCLHFPGTTLCRPSSSNNNPDLLWRVSQWCPDRMLFSVCDGHARFAMSVFSVLSVNIDTYTKLQCAQCL